MHRFSKYQKKYQARVLYRLNHYMPIIFSETGKRTHDIFSIFCITLECQKKTKHNDIINVPFPSENTSRV